MIAREELNRGAAPPHSLVEVFEAMAARSRRGTATKQKREGAGSTRAGPSWPGAPATSPTASPPSASARATGWPSWARSTTEWILADLGVMGAAAITVPIYQSNKAHDCQYILANSGARYVFCDGEARRRRSGGAPGAPRAPRDHPLRRRGAHGFERTLAELERAGAAWRATNPRAHAARGSPRSRSRSRRPSSTPPARPATPRASCSPTATGSTRPTPSRRSSSSGPMIWCSCSCRMAHSFAQGHRGGLVRCGATVAFVESIEKIVDNAGEVRPTVMPAVPRIFEKAYNAVVSKGLATPGLRGTLFKWSMESLEA